MRTPSHPGVVLMEEFLRPGNISQVALARHVGVPLQRVNQIVHGKRGITADTAWRLAGALGTTALFWMNLQAQHDLARGKPARLPLRIRTARAASQRRGGSP